MNPSAVDHAPGATRCGLEALSLALLALAVAACGPAGGGGTAEREKSAALRQAPGLDRSVLDDPTRPEDERGQDAARKAIDVYEWVGIRPGMTVADVFAGRGYNTHLLSRIVGDEGRVFSVFEFYANKDVFDGRIYFLDDVEQRVADAGLGNVTLLEKITELPEGAIDAMIIVRNYHDVEWVFADMQRAEVLAALYRALKPGAPVGVVEVATDSPGWDQATHRLNEQVVIEDFTGVGFALEDRSAMLANPEDDHSTSGFEEGRHTMDRYLLRFRKP